MAGARPRGADQRPTTPTATPMRADTARDSGTVVTMTPTTTGQTVYQEMDNTFLILKLIVFVAHLLVSDRSASTLTMSRHIVRVSDCHDISLLIFH